MWDDDDDDLFLVMNFALIFTLFRALSLRVIVFMVHKKLIYIIMSLKSRGRVTDAGNVRKKNSD